MGKKLPKTQLDRFKEAARELEADDDEERFNEKLKQLAKGGSKKPALSDVEQTGNDHGDK